MVLKKTMIKQFGIFSVAKFGAILGLIYGLIIGISIFLTGSAEMGKAIGMAGMAGLGIGAILVGIIMGAIIGFIFGAIAAFIYNLVLEAIGGIEVDLDIAD
jgi:hypothetical protein